MSIWPTSSPFPPRLRVALPLLGVLVAYVSLRLALLPGDPGAVYGFSHDSGYITIVARNVLAGRGLVNDAHWLVFLDVDTLPVPYHNANPLFPLTVAAAGALAGGDVQQAGFVVTVLSSAVLIAALAVLLVRFRAPAPVATVIAVLAGTSPLVLDDSFRLLPDTLWTALMVAGVAVLVRPAEEAWGWRRTALSGAFFGLAWLTRSTAILFVPALAIYALGTLGWKRGALHLGALLAAWTLVASPWLLYTYGEWGSPFRSDSASYTFLEIYSRPYGGSYRRFFHSPVPPPSIAHVLQAEPRIVGELFARGAPQVARDLAMAWSGNSRGTALLLALPVAYLLTRRRRLALHPVALSTAAYGVTLVGVFALRPNHLELRYFELLNVLLGALLAFSAWWALRESLLTNRSGIVEATVVASGLIVWMAVFPPRSAAAAASALRVDPELVAYRSIATAVHRDHARGTPVVAGSTPYFYTAATGGPSLSMPFSDDEFLRRFMRKFGARFVLLTRAEREFWRPAWGESGHPAWLEPIARIADATLYRARDTALVMPPAVRVMRAPSAP